MKRLSLTLALIALPLWAAAQAAPYAARQVTLASTFDLDGEAADDDQIVTAANGVITDSTSYTLTADPDVCRLVDVTVTDADSSISAGTLTIAGFDCWGYPLKAEFALNGGSGVRTGTVVDFDSASPKKASAAYFSDVTAVSNGAVTGEGGAADTIKVGYTSNSAKGWPMYGRVSDGPYGRVVNPFGAYNVNVLVKNGAATTDITAVSASTTAPFENVSAGDLLVFNVGGDVVERRVVTRTDADNVVINTGLTLPTAGLNFSYRKHFFFSDPIDGWISVKGYDVATFMVQVDLNANTGGVISSIECGTYTTEGLTAVDVVFEEDTATVASAATGTDISTIDLRDKPQYTHCRASVRFGTGDDADAAAEDIDIVLGLRK